MRFIAFLICLVAPLPAMALSCARPSVERSYGQAAKADESYVVVKGRLTFDESKLPKANTQTQTAPKRTVIKARFQGHALSGADFSTSFNAALNYEVRCLVVWCGGGQSGEEIIAFVQKTPSGYTLEMGPCGGWAFPATRKNTMAVLSCARGSTCTR
ncbi:hypothetical protein [Ascidiaceihabitans sp.]|uniref:hypothetical protein n=1 Tax=Ascidiaceihabitans sp. TaxID=1872644 RepID=UPI003297D334